MQKEENHTGQQYIIGFWKEGKNLNNEDNKHSTFTPPYILSSYRLKWVIFPPLTCMPVTGCSAGSSGAQTGVGLRITWRAGKEDSAGPTASFGFSRSGVGP